jgi:hypothetical protein
MIAELDEDMSCHGCNELGSEIPWDNFPRARYQSGRGESATPKARKG